MGRPVRLVLSVEHTAADAAAEAALQAASPIEAILCLSVEVKPSSAPAALVIMQDGQRLPLQRLSAEVGTILDTSLWSYVLCRADMKASIVRGGVFRNMCTYTGSWALLISWA